MVILYARLRSVDTAGATCLNNDIGGFYDPPYASTKASASIISTSVAPAQSPQPVVNETAPPLATSTLPTRFRHLDLLTRVLSRQLHQLAPTDPPADPGTSTLSPQGGSMPSANDPGVPASQFVIDSQTLSPGGPAVTVQGTTFSLLTTGSGVVIYGVTTNPPASAAPASPVVQNPASQAIIGGSVTLIPGGPAITVNGTTYSEPSSGSIVIVNGTPTTVWAATSPATGSSKMSNRPVYQTTNAGSKSAVGPEGFLAAIAVAVGG